jgi:hypothetical protein
VLKHPSRSLNLVGCCPPSHPHIHDDRTCRRTKFEPKLPPVPVEPDTVEPGTVKPEVAPDEEVSIESSLNKIWHHKNCANLINSSVCKQLGDTMKAFQKFNIPSQPRERLLEHHLTKCILYNNRDCTKGDSTTGRRQLVMGNSNDYCCP